MTASCAATGVLTIAPAGGGGAGGGLWANATELSASPIAVSRREYWMFIGEYLLPGVKQLTCHSKKQAKPFYRRVFMDADGLIYGGQ